MPQNRDRNRSMGGSRQDSAIGRDVPRDNQQIQDDNQTSGESVAAGQTSGDNRQPVGGADSPNRAANREPAEGARDTAGDGGGRDAGGISNRPLSEEEDRQHNLPPRGEAKGDSHA